MKKLILATAISAFSVSASAAEKPSVDVYGHINVTYQHTYEETVFGAFGDGGDLNGRGTTVGIYSEHEVAPGVTGFARAEVDFSDLTSDFLGSIRGDEVYIGVSGSAGKLWVGRDDSFMEDLVDQTSGFYETYLMSGQEFMTYSFRDSDRLKYESPALPSYVDGGLVKLVASIGRTDVSQYSDPSLPEKVDSEFDYEVGLTHSTDHLDVSLVASSNRNLMRNGIQASALTYGVHVGADVTENFRLRGSLMNRGESDALSEERYYSLMSQYTQGKVLYTLSYANHKAEMGGFAADYDVIAGQIGYNASETLFLFAEAQAGESSAIPAYALPESKGNSLAVGAIYYF